MSTSDIRYFTTLVKNTTDYGEIAGALDYLIEKGTPVVQQQLLQQQPTSPLDSDNIISPISDDATPISTATDDNNNNNDNDNNNIIEFHQQELEIPLEQFSNLENLSELVETLWWKLGTSILNKSRDFFQICIDITLRKICSNDLPAEYIKMLACILSPKLFHRGGDNGGYNQDFELILQLPAQLANYFAQRGGMSILMSNIQLKKGSFDSLKKMLYIMKKVTKRTKLEFSEPDVEAFIQVVFKRILDTPDEEFKNESRKDLDICMNKYLRAIVRNVSDNMFADLIHSKFMEVALKCFKSVSLEKRNSGLNDIISFIKHESLYMYSKAYTHSTDKVVNWLRDNRIVEQLYGETMHIQLLQKCSDILKYLAEKKAFQQQYLDLMWSAAEGKHETIENTIYETIGNIAPLLPIQHIEYLFESKIKAIPFEHYTPQTLQLIYCLIQNRQAPYSNSGSAVYSQEESREHIVHHGLEIFWTLLQDENEALIAPELSNNVLTLLQDTLYFHQPQRHDYLRKSIENIANHKSVLFSLRIIQFSITIFTDRQKKSTSIADSSAVIDHINNSMRLMEKLYEHLYFYKQQCKSIIDNRMSTNCDEQSLGDTPIYGRHSHYEQINEFLAFISFVWEKSTLSASNDNIDVLWQVFAVDPITSNDRNIFFKWAQTCFTEANFEYILQKFEEISFVNLEPPGASLYVHCMKTLNQGRPASNYVGIDILWKIALEAENEEVGKEAISYIIDLYKSMPTRESEFLPTCISNLSNIATTSIDGTLTLSHSDHILVNRTLALLQTYLEGFGSKYRDSFKKNFYPSINVTFASQRHKIPLQVRCSETVGQIKQRLASIIHAHPGSIYIVHKTKMLQFDYETFSDYQVHNHDHLMFNEWPEPKIQEPAQMVQIHFDQSKLSLLFSLLAIEEIAPTVWDVLMLLPVSHQIFQALANIPSSFTETTQQFNWGDLINQSSVYKLLYTLLIVENLVQREDNNYEWRHRFITTGGLSHLFKVLMRDDFHQVWTCKSSNKRKRCLSSMINTIVLLVIDHSNLTINLSGVSAAVVPNFTPTAFLNRLMDLAWKQALPTVQKEDLMLPHVTDDGDIISNFLTLILAMVQHNNDLLDQFCTKRKDITKWIQLLLLDSSDPSIRECTSNRFYTLCQHNAVAHEFFQSQCLTLLPFIVGSDKYAFSSNQFFLLLLNLLQDSCRNGDTPKFAKLLQELAAMLKSHPIVESPNMFQSDYVLIGIINMLRTLVGFSHQFKVKAGNDHLIQEVFHECLFNIATADNHGPLCPPKAKSKDSRDACFALLLELANNCEENYKELVLQLIEQNKPDERRSVWNYFPMGNEKSSCGYVGLKNLGATCYINSLMQQLFMIPGFRYSILQAEDSATNANPDSLLYQLKIIFANLQESEKKSHDPKDFCLAYKYEGQPINTYVQMDVDEFFNMLFDRLENQLKGTKEEKLLNQFFGGASVNQFISQECAHVSEREEPFYTISVEVKNKKDITESLQLFVESETLDGDNKYFCSQCSQKVKCLMRRCIKSLPNTLIIHNKRFEFDLDTMKRTKLNDALKFPMTLDMTPYTKEYLEGKEAVEKAKANNLPIPKDLPAMQPASYYQYDLSGILVHSGTADSGHYYSFIKEREPLIPGRPRHWIQFNDQLTEVFNPEDISRACFGGYDSISLDQGKTNIRTSQRNNNAYMLFYERSHVVNNTTTTPVGPSMFKSLSQAQQSKLVPREMFSTVWKNNMKFLTDKNIFDLGYFEFISNIIHLNQITKNNVDGLHNIAIDHNNNNNDVVHMSDDPDFDQRMMSIELGTRFVIETLSHSKERKQLGDFVLFLNAMYESHQGACRWFLDTVTTDPTWIKQNMLVCITTEPREALSKIILQVFATLLPEDRQYYFDMESVSPDSNGDNDSPMDIIDIDSDRSASGKQKALNQNVMDQELSSSSHLIGRPKSYIARFMDTYLDFIKEVSLYWKHFHQYFTLIRDFANIGIEERRFLLNRCVISRLIHFYMGDDSPMAKTNPPQKKVKMGDKYNSPQLQTMLETIAILVQAAHTRYSTQDDTRLPTHTDEPIAINEDDLYMLTNPHFYIKTVIDSINLKASNDIMRHMCFGDIKLSKNLISQLRQTDSRSTPDALITLITLEDHWQRDRAHSAIKAFIEFMEEVKQSAFAPHIKYLLQQAAETPIIGQWFMLNKDEWLIRWLVEHDSIDVRYEAYKLLIALYSLDDAQSNADRVNELFQYLMEQSKDVKVMAREEKDVQSGRFEYYFKLLTLCTISDEEKRLLGEYKQPMFKMLEQFISCQVATDRNRQECVRFIANMLNEYPDNVRLMLDDPVKGKLMDYFISISPNEELKLYNKKSLPGFYQIILYLAQEKMEFLNMVGTHNNFYWAINFLYLECGEYAEVGKVLIQILELVAQRIPAATYKILTNCMGFINFHHYPPHMLPLLSILTTKRKDAQAYLNTYGGHQSNERWVPIEVLCKILKNKAHTTDLNIAPKLLEVLSKVLNLLRKDNTSPAASNVVGESMPQSPPQLWDASSQSFRTVVNSLISAAEQNIHLLPHINKLINQIAIECPEGFIVVVTEIFNKKSADLDNLAANQTQRSERFYIMLLDVLNLCGGHSNANSPVQQKSIILIFKIIKEMIAVGLENGYKVLATAVGKYSAQIKDEEKIAIITFAIKHTSTLSNQEFFDINKRFVIDTDGLVSKDSNPTYSLWCQLLYDQVQTSIASINSLSNDNAASEVDQHLADLTNTLKSLELLGNGRSATSTNSKHLTAVCEMLEAFNKELAHTPAFEQSDRAKQFKSCLESLQTLFASAASSTSSSKSK
ncbi:hypothetical protein SAMD00019534_117220 [Acytostelium subglobosum LB1]|uniref:hypothetical protein n=1 Tax=Acytostelium subglobosum LB1 TaxID=1410327 RepID=UPI000644EBF2|nr:hypothetical protein SAMD00019534_117220 [Acytostelium subglobosum LB1]GAM28546.1 hypothetical protein SAMD00019534_117220 [Acytostelium subglobosum LB1]|eukprot:XP_012748585.1 hypothetical protein SAMD00019534_117220 [Acytostelium subglobosum LB1]